MSRHLKTLLAATAVALATALLSTAAFADDDDWEDYWEDQEEAWEDYYKSQRRHNHYRQPTGYWHGADAWHGGYGVTPYNHYHAQPYYYGYGGQPYGYGYPTYGGSYYGHGCRHGHYGRSRGGFYFGIR